MAEYMPPKVFTANVVGEIDYLSPQWYTYTGLTFSDMDTVGWSNVMHPNDRDENFRRWQYCVRTGSSYYIENRLQRADGEYRWHLTTAHAMREQSRGLKARLQVLAKQREQLLITNRSKDEFIMLASHQLRTPASGVKQFVGMIIQGYVGNVPPKQMEILKRAYDCNERQIKITDDLLKVARIDTGQVSLTKIPCNAIELIRNVIAEQEATYASRKQKVHFNPQRDKVAIFADVKLIYMVLENLLDNASKYSPHGATVTVSIRKSKDWVSISVRDTGVGISKEDKSKLFQKFSRITNPLSDTVGGSGLGLYLAKKIIELHNGSLNVNSVVGQGTTFTIKLPVK
jgi:PAS domain S-box-containing protein